MPSLYIDERKKKIILFCSIMIVTMGMVVILSSWLLNPEGGTASLLSNSDNNNQELNRLFEKEEAIQSAFMHLQELDEQFAATLSSDYRKATPIVKNIGQQEADLSNLINEADNDINQLQSSLIRKKLAKMIRFYQSALDNRRSISTLRNAIDLQNSSFSTDEKAVLQLQNELQARNSRIQLLETTLFNIHKNEAATVTASGNNEQAKQLLDLNATVQRLTTTNDLLQGENEKLRNQLTAAAKPGTAGGDGFYKERASVLQQKIDALNAEIQLTQADCNIARADASQVVYGTRQRRQLLAEATAILNTLAASADEDIKRKARDKQNRLSQVAARAGD